MTDADLSPNANAMAEAAYTAAVAQVERQSKNKRNLDEIELNHARDSDQRGDGNVVLRPAKPCRADHDEIFSDARHSNDAGRENEVGIRIEEIWKSGNKADANFSETLRLLTGELDSFVQMGLSAFYDLDTTSRQLAQSKELAETRSREAQRLQSIDEQSRASLSVSRKGLPG